MAIKTMAITEVARSLPRLPREWDGPVSYYGDPSGTVFHTVPKKLPAEDVPADWSLYRRFRSDGILCSSAPVEEESRALDEIQKALPEGLFWLTPEQVEASGVKEDYPYAVGLALWNPDGWVGSDSRFLPIAVLTRGVKDEVVDYRFARVDTGWKEARTRVTADVALGGVAPWHTES